METIDEIKKKSEIPQFLKVLCILTFIGSGLGILTGLLLITAYPIFRNFYAFSGIESISIIMGCIVMIINAGTLLGALLMWKKNVNGFYIYVTAQLVNISSPLLLDVFSGIHTEQNPVSYLFPVIFIAMYAANYKYLKIDGDN